MITPHPDGYPVKLVRDDIARALGGDGTVTYRPVGSHAEHVKLLRKKLIEEAIEYAIDPSLDELAQVLLAVHTLARADLGVSVVELRATMIADVAERGGFDNGIVMSVLHPVDVVTGEAA